VLALLREVVDWVRPAFDSAGYAIVFGAVLLERSILLEIVIPGELILALGGVFAARGDLNLAPLLVGTMFMSVAGESIGYWLGRRYGEPLLARMPFGGRIRPKLDRVRAHFERHGGPTVAIGRYAAGAGAIVPFVAGMSGLSYPRFLLWDVPANIAWVIAVVLLGYYLGDNLDTIDRILGRIGYVGLGIFIAFLAGTLWWRRRRPDRADAED